MDWEVLEQSFLAQKFMMIMMMGVVFLLLVLLVMAENRVPYIIEVDHDQEKEEEEEEEKNEDYKACSFCGKLSKMITSCSCCKTTLYCSAVCLMIHLRLWHKYECIENVKESSCILHEDEYTEEKAEHYSTNEQGAQFPIDSFEKAVDEPLETAEQVRSLEEELAKFKNENLSLKSERDNWEMQTKDAEDKLNSFMKESEHQMLILKHKMELISNAEKQARSMVHSLSERLHWLQVAEGNRVAEMRRQEDYIQMLHLQIIATDNLSRNSPLHNKQACAICLSNEKDMAFGCGHMTCRECGPRISKCPICREEIISRVRLFHG